MSTPATDSSPGSPSATNVAPTPSEVPTPSDASTTTDTSTTDDDPTTDTSMTDDAATTDDTTSSSGEVGIRIDGNQILVDGEVLHIRGVNWNPVPKGQDHPAGLAYAAMADIDIPLMKAAGINAVRTYEHLDDREVLDKLHTAGISVFSTVLGWWQDETSVVVERVNSVKDHPAIVAWVVGNEWNYNHLYGYENLTEEETRDKLNEAARLIKATDATRPVTTIWGGLPPKSMIDAMPDIDVWGLNVYGGVTFGPLFEQFAGISSKPMYLGEYGVDAYNTTAGAYDPEAQAQADKQLTEEILTNLVTTPGGVTSGGFIFEWADEWWKDGSGALDQQGVAGIEGSLYPDNVFNEEWWGIVDIDRNPRPAYEALKALYAP